MGAKTDINVYHEIGSKMGKFDLWLPIHGIVTISHLKYHSDWNWLMEVVEKIESIKIQSYLVRVDINLNSCKIAPSHWEERICVYGDKETKIQTVYNACIEFVKWYLENSAKEN
jgi:hypothetical protein